MSDLPKRIRIHEEGPREGFQIEPGPIATEDKVRFCEALAETGLTEVQCVSFVDPRRVPGMADAVEVAHAIRQKPGVHYTAIALNLKGYERAVQTPLHITGGLQMSASNTFSIHNTNKDNAETLVEQRRQLGFFRERGIPVDSAIVMTAFGCNFEGAIAPETVRDCVAALLELADAFGITLERVRLADTVGWASPLQVQRVVGAVRERWPDLPLSLHLHDTRGTGLANALTALQMGITDFDSSCAGLGGCPFAGHKGAAGNICTED
ncbi:MAG: hydroxymethylglutaryl-CoA lyase, partial [Rhodospirillales bacterium]|nr:hydroxymethylglutaryl-CoA lyase [Rhodospirillales bacterium]